jgi:hypothetical protein
MKSIRLISALTVVMISSGFLVSCNKDNNQNNAEDPHSMDLAQMTDIDTNTGTYTGNIYAEDEESAGSINSNTLANVPEKTRERLMTNPKGNSQLMDNPSAVNHAEQQGKREKGAVYVDQKEAYVDRPVNSATVGTPVTNGNKIAMAQQSNTGTGSMANPNQKKIDDLKKQVNDLVRKEMSLKTKIKDAKLTPTYKTGVKNPGGPAGAAINKEIASFQAQRVKLQQQIAGLQNQKK